MRIEAPAGLCGRPAVRPVVDGARRARFRSVGGGPWAVVGLDRRGVERARVAGYRDEDEARASIEFHPAGTALAYSVVLDEGPVAAG